MFNSYKEFENAKVNCKKCHIGSIYNQVVPSEGNKTNPVVMVIGEAPGRDEIENKRPFVGKAGRRLRATLNKYGFRNSNTLISNVIPCRPENNKFPTDIELINSCMQKWLIEEIKLLNPDYLLLLGNQPLKYILGETGITKKRGKWHYYHVNNKPINCMPTFHPSYVCRKEHMQDGIEIIKNFEKDIEALAKEAKIL
jgi:uracil-DNA glycosylase